MNVIGVRKHRSAVQQSYEPVRAELGVEARQVIIAELVDHYANDQADRLRGGRRIDGAAALLRGGGSGKEVSERENKTERLREARAIQRSCRHDLSLKGCSRNDAIRQASIIAAKMDDKAPVCSDALPAP